MLYSADIFLLQVFPGNFDRHSIVVHDLVPSFHARRVKIHPLSYKKHISMRVELYGCPIKVRLKGALLNKKFRYKRGLA